MTGTPQPNPTMQAILDEMAALGAKPLETLTPTQARKQPTPADAVAAVLKARGQDAMPEAVGSVEDRSIVGPGGPIALRIYHPKDAQPGAAGFPVVLYIHGGGWVIADLDVYDASPRAVANAAGAIVVSTHYRQGPEHLFPAAHEDTFAAYLWLLDNAASLGGDANNIALVGESAGGNMAANIAINAREMDITVPVHQVLVYPVANNDMDSPSYLENASAKPLGKAAMGWFVQHAFESAERTNDSRIKLVDRTDLGNLPPATIILAQIDPLRSEGEAYGKALTAAGVQVTQQCWTGVTHEFFGMAALLDEAKQAQALVGERLREAFR